MCFSHPLKTGLFKSSICPATQHSLGTKFRHLVVKIALLFFFSIIFPKLLSSLLLHFFLSIYPWLTWFPRGQINDTILDCKSVIVITIRYIFCSNQYLYGVGGCSARVVTLHAAPILLLVAHNNYQLAFLVFGHPYNRGKLKMALGGYNIFYHVRFLGTSYKV